MQKGQNFNRPEKGSSIKVEPIRNVKDIKAIRKQLADNPRDLALFVIGINTNLRASDLVKLTAGDFRGKHPGDTLELKEQKTGKGRIITINQAVYDAVSSLLASREYTDAMPLFMSQRGDKALTVPSVNRLVKDWCRTINLRGNYGSHTLRKTFGYHQHTQNRTGIPELMVMFNHSSQRQTLDYLCIQHEAIEDAYMSLNL